MAYSQVRVEVSYNGHETAVPIFLCCHDYYRIMGLEISDAFLGTTARPRLRARVFFCHIENKVVLEVVIDF